jgi:hypothetical protein
VIFLALCELADVDPHDANDVEDSRWDQPEPHLKRLQRYWNHAVDGAPMPERPKTRKERAEELAAEQERAAAARQRQADNPWGSAPPRSGFSDEPPF